jgi:pimeloyl-ACP methyl ester carboxylesterase
LRLQSYAKETNKLLKGRDMTVMNILSQLVLVLNLSLCPTIISWRTDERRQTSMTTKTKQPRIILKDCDGLRGHPDAKCGTYDVYEDRESKRGRKIALKIIVLPALSATAAPDPLFILAGGPGQAATASVSFWAGTFAGVRRERDLILVDQRGAGGSNGLDCDLYGGKLQSYFGDRFPEEGARACRQILEPRADLRLYTTPIAMDDLDEVRDALGYDKINLFGTSYGTRAAQVYLRMYPSRVRSVIMKGLMRFDLSPATDTDRSIDLLFGDCLSDTACNSLYPDIKREYQGLLASLERKNVRVTIKHPDTAQSEEVEFGPVILTSTLRSLLQNVGSANQALMLIHQAAKGNFEPLAQTVISLRRGLVKGISIGMMLSVFCSEDASFTKGDIAIGPDKLTPACRQWPKGKVPEWYSKPVNSDAPALLISGFLDPATPPSWGEEVARGFPNGLHLVIRNASHSYTGLSPCVDRIMAQFISTGSAKGLDTACVNQIRRPQFKDIP